MRIHYSTLILVILFAACNSQPSSPDRQASQPPSQSTQRATQSTQPPLPTNDPLESVQHLLKWYRWHYDSLEGFALVNIHNPDDSVPPGKDTLYNSVNFGETARYLQALRSSGFFTNEFLADKQAYFRRCDSFFTIKKELDGSPTGFDRDILLSSSNTDEFLSDSISPAFELVNPGTVVFDKYLIFSLKRSGDTCRIDKIRFVQDPDSAADLVYTQGADSTDPLIRSIRTEVKNIEADQSKFHSVEKDIMDQSTEGGDGRLRYEGKQLRQARFEFFGETGKAYSQYYFVHGKIIFCYRRETRYTKPFYRPNYGIGLIKTVRHYFQNGHLVRVIDEKGKLVEKGLYTAIQRELAEVDSAILPTFSQ